MSDAQPLDLYIQSVESAAKAEVCARQSEPFRAAFAQRFAAWRSANADALARGQAEAAARGMTEDGLRSVAGFAAFGAKALEALPEDDRQRRCDELLAMYLADRSRR